MVVHVFNSITQEAKAGRSWCIPGQSGLHNMFQDSQNYRERIGLTTTSQLPKVEKKLNIFFLLNRNF